MPFVSSLRGTFGPTSENKGVGSGIAIAEVLRANPGAISGGTITQAGGFRIHTFVTGSQSGNTFTFNSTPSGTTVTADYLIVAGGGGGGDNANICSPGGAGGYRTGSMTISPGSYSVVVGAGANRRTADGNTVIRGGTSSFNGVNTTGGGCGNRGENGGDTNINSGASGGSGGGGAYNNTGSNNGGAGTPGEGNAGGTGSTQAGVHGSGGGGGAGAAGQAGNNSIAGVGGSGLQNSISGTATFYAGGGGGGAWSGGNIIAGGAGGGGQGAGGNNVGQSTAGTNGLGGGGGGDYNTGNAKPGGSGIVIIRYPI